MLRICYTVLDTPTPDGKLLFLNLETEVQKKVLNAESAAQTSLKKVTFTYFLYSLPMLRCGYIEL